jgi:hypothetical protein
MILAEQGLVGTAALGCPHNQFQERFRLRLRINIG